MKHDINENNRIKARANGLLYQKQADDGFSASLRFS